MPRLARSTIVLTVFAAAIAAGAGLKAAAGGDATGAAPGPVAEEALALVAGSKCAAQSRELLGKWNVALTAGQDWLRQPASLDGGKTFMAPTDRIGTWVRVTAFPDSSLELTRKAPDSSIVARWRASDCVPELAPRPGARIDRKVASTLYTDHDLQEALSGAPAGIIYAWSPQAPQSVRGYAEARSLARKLDIAFVPVLDPDADSRDTARAASLAHIPPAAQRRAQSLELSVRGLGLNYPSTLVFNQGRFARLLPGYWSSPGAFETAVREALKR